jgi:amino acid permease
MVFTISLISALVFSTGDFAYFMAQSGSFKPLPVRVQVITAFCASVSFNYIIPAMVAQLAGSAKTPSFSASIL